MTPEPQGWDSSSIRNYKITLRSVLSPLHFDVGLPTDSVRHRPTHGGEIPPFFRCPIVPYSKSDLYYLGRYDIRQDRRTSQCHETNWLHIRNPMLSTLMIVWSTTCPMLKMMWANNVPILQEKCLFLPVSAVMPSSLTDNLRGKKILLWNRHGVSAKRK